MRIRTWVGISVTSLALGALPLQAATLFSDGFESYNNGALDKNTSGGPNVAANGSGNPWFGPNPPNGQVTGTVGAISPNSGSKMLGGRAPSDFDQDWVNAAYRFNGGSAFTGNIQLDFWFYDSLGAGGSNLRDTAGIAFYNTAPSSTDYPTAASHVGDLNFNATQIQRLVLGAGSDISGSYNSGVYQARVVGATGGYDGTTGWFNTTTSRGIGWHHGRIVIGAALGDNTNNVSFYIDDMTNPDFTHNSVTSYGYNVIELNSNFGSTTGYFDDVSLSTVPEPAALALLGLVIPLALRRPRRLAMA